MDQVVGEEHSLAAASHAHRLAVAHEYQTRGPKILNKAAANNIKSCSRSVDESDIKSAELYLSNHKDDSQSQNRSSIAPPD